MDVQDAFKFRVVGLQDRLHILDASDVATTLLHGVLHEGTPPSGWLQGL